MRTRSSVDARKGQVKGKILTIRNPSLYSAPALRQPGYPPAMPAPKRRRDSDHSWLRHARDEAGLDQVELARRAGISRRSVAAYERGETPIPPPKRVLLEQALHERREELGYDEPVAKLRERLQAIEAINLRILSLTDEIAETVQRNTQQLTTLALASFPREVIRQAVEAELIGQLAPEVRQRLVSALRAEAEVLLELAGRLAALPASVGDERPPLETRTGTRRPGNPRVSELTPSPFD